MGNNPRQNFIECLSIDQARLHILFLSCTRYVVEKHGGIMETDPETYNAIASIPESNKEACLEELETMFGPNNLLI